MDALLEPVASSLGASLDQIKLILCLLVAYPLGSVYIRVPATSPALRHLFNIGVAGVFFFGVLGIWSAFLHLLASVLATYVIAKYDKSKNMPWRVFFVVMGHLTANHIIRAINGTNFETVEVTGPQMVLTMKLTTFAWNVHDGRLPSEELDKWQSTKKIVQYPSLLAFLGYSFYFPGILVGPYLDFQEYSDVVHETVFRDPSVKSKHNSGRAVPPGRKRVAYTKMGLGLIYLGAFAFLGPKWNFFATLRPEFRQMNFVYRMLFFHLYGVVERMKYYAIWTLTEGASVLTGLGFNGFTEPTKPGEAPKPKWDGAANIIITKIEMPENMKGVVDAWNMKTNVWLKECVYKRVAPKGKKPGHQVTAITWLTSAFWHGIALGYYLTFIMGALITSAARIARQSIRPIFLAPSPYARFKPIYDIVGGIISLWLLDYIGSPFMIGTLSDCFAAWSALHWFGHVIVLGGLVFFYAGGSRWLKGVQKACGVAAPPKSSAPVNGRAVNGSATASGTSIPLTEKNFVVPGAR